MENKNVIIVWVGMVDLQDDPLVYSILCDPCQLCTEFGEFRVLRWLHINLEFVYNPEGRDV